MLQNLSQQVRECLQHAEDCAHRAKIEPDPNLARDFVVLDHFSIGWPTDATATEQFRLRMQLIAWRWKLTGIDLPDKLRDQFARELAKKYP